MKTACRDCGKSFSVPDTWDAADAIACPKCGTSQRVGNRPAGSQGAGSQGARLGTESGRRVGGKPSVPAPPASDEDDDEDGELRLAPEEARPTVDMLVETPGPSVNTRDGKSSPPRAGVAPPRAGAAPAAAAPRASSDRNPSKPPSRCENCGGPMPPDGMLCVACGYHVTLKRVLQSDLSDLELDSSTGIERWLGNQLADGESASSLLWAIHAVVAIGLAVIGLVFHPWSWICVGVLGTGYLVLVVWLRSGPGSRAAGWLAWSFMLGLRRRFGWRNLAPPFARPRVFSARESGFTDSDLENLAERNELEVLDLEGTGITDQSLRHFQTCDRLRAAVVRGTRLTRGGVVRLQIMKPDLAIWHDVWDS